MPALPTVPTLPALHVVPAVHTLHGQEAKGRTRAVHHWGNNLQGSAGQLAAERHAEQKQHAQQTAQFEAQIQALDSLRYDLEQAKANLTAKLEISSAANTSLEIQILEVRMCLFWYHSSSHCCSKEHKLPCTRSNLNF